MAEVSKKFLRSKTFVEKFNQILKEGDPTTLTASSIRKQLEDFFELERDSLKEQPWKNEINTMIDDYAKTLDVNGADSSDENDDDHVKDEDSELENDDNDDDNSRTKDKQPQKDKDMDADDKGQQLQQLSHKIDDDDEEQEEEESPNQKRKDRKDGTKDTSDTESTSTKAPSEKKQRKDQPAPKKQAVKKEPKKISADEETIKRLKNYIRKCGVAVIRHKELADCPTLKSQIRKLKSMLEDLGVEGRPTIEKCEKIKKQRELKAEIEGLDAENILPSSKRGLRSGALSSNKRKRRIVEDDSEDDDRDAPAPLDMSFLGNQSEEDSD